MVLATIVQRIACAAISRKGCAGIWRGMCAPIWTPAQMSSSAFLTCRAAHTFQMGKGKVAFERYTPPTHSCAVSPTSEYTVRVIVRSCQQLPRFASHARTPPLRAGKQEHHLAAPPARCLAIHLAYTLEACVNCTTLQLHRAICQSSV